MQELAKHLDGYNVRDLMPYLRQLSKYERNWVENIDGNWAIAGKYFAELGKPSSIYLSSAWYTIRNYFVLLFKQSAEIIEQYSKHGISNVIEKECIVYKMCWKCISCFFP